DRLVPGTEACRRRRARYLAVLGGREGPARPRGRPAGALDSFLVGHDTWLEEGDPQAALGPFRRPVPLPPDLRWARFFLAIAHLKVGQAAQARAELTLCVGQRRNFVWGYLFRGFLNGELRAFEEAEADFDRAGRLAPDGPARYVVHVNRGV